MPGWLHVCFWIYGVGCMPCRQLLPIFEFCSAMRRRLLLSSGVQFEEGMRCRKLLCDISCNGALQCQFILPSWLRCR